MEDERGDKRTSGGVESGKGHTGGESSVVGDERIDGRTSGEVESGKGRTEGEPGMENEHGEAYLWRGRERQRSHRR